MIERIVVTHAAQKIKHKTRWARGPDAIAIIRRVEDGDGKVSQKEHHAPSRAKRIKS